MRKGLGSLSSELVTPGNRGNPPISLEFPRNGEEEDSSRQVPCCWLVKVKAALLTAEEGLLVRWQLQGGGCWEWKRVGERGEREGGSSPASWPHATSHLHLPQTTTGQKKEDSSFYLPSQVPAKQGLCMCGEGEGSLTSPSSVFLHRALKD